MSNPDDKDWLSEATAAALNKFHADHADGDLAIHVLAATVRAHYAKELTKVTKPYIGILEAIAETMEEDKIMLRTAKNIRDAIAQLNKEGK